MENKENVSQDSTKPKKLSKEERKAARDQPKV